MKFTPKVTIKTDEEQIENYLLQESKCPFNSENAIFSLVECTCGSHGKDEDE